MGVGNNMGYGNLHAPRFYFFQHRFSLGVLVPLIVVGWMKLKPVTYFLF